MNYVDENDKFKNGFKGDDAENRQLVTQSLRAQDNTCTTQNKKTLREYRCGTGQKPSDG